MSEAKSDLIHLLDCYCGILPNLDKVSGRELYSYVCPNCSMCCDEYFSDEETAKVNWNDWIENPKAV